VQLAEKFYTSHKSPVIFQVSPIATPPELDATLTSKGYVYFDPSQVQTANLSSILEAPAEIPEAWHATEQLTRQWFETWCEATELLGQEASAEFDILQRVKARSLYVTLALDGKPAAVGRGVVEREWLGVFNMATLPAIRGRGAGSRILTLLAKWGNEQGALYAYLQVDSDNIPALRLYAKTGFDTLYQYHYRLENPNRSSLR
jgi:ribosomal protein S18 acetylase RimI-like enzyme